MGLKAHEEIYKTNYEEKYLDFDFSKVLDTGESIASAAISISPAIGGIANTTPTVDGPTVTTKISGGLDGTTYLVDCKIVTNTQKREVSGRLRVDEVFTLVSGGGDLSGAPGNLAGDGPPDAGLGEIGQGYVDLLTADYYVKVASGWQHANYPGASLASSAEFNLTGGSSIDESENLASIMAYLDMKAGAPYHVIIRSLNGYDPIYINKTISLEASNVELEFQSPILYGANGSLRIQGTQSEITRNGKEKSKLRQNETAGNSTLHLSTNATNMQASDYLVGDVIVIRGQNDANGKAIEKQVAHIASIDTGNNNLTLTEELDYSFKATYPLSDYPPDLTTGTTISLAESATLIVNAVPGDKSVTVNATQLAASSMTTGSVVQLSTNETEYDIDPLAVTTGAVPYKNTARIEYKQIVSVDTGTGVVIFDSPVIDSYQTAKAATIIRINSVQNSRIIGIRGTFTGDQTTRSTHSVQLTYAFRCAIEDCTIDGIGGQKANGIRASNCFDCVIKDCQTWNAKNTDSGDGYGITVFYSERTRVINCVSKGNRHNFLMQKSNHTEIGGCWSVNELVSGIDIHGVRSFNTHIHDCYLIGGPTYASGIDNKSALRVGNSSHANGDFNTLIENCFVTGCNALNGSSQETYAGFEMFGASSGVTLRGVRFSECSVGIRIGNNAQFDQELNTNIVIDGCELSNITTMFDIDGESTNKDVRDIIISNCTSIGNSTHFKIKNAQRLKLIGNRVLSPVNSSGTYAFDVQSCVDVEIIGNSAHKANRGLYVSGNTNLVLGGNKWQETIDATAFVDGGSNTYSGSNGGRVRVNSALTTSTSFGTGASETIPVDTSTPSISNGLQIISTTYTATQPNRTVRLSFVVPYVSTSATDNVTAHIFVGGSVVGSAVTRMNTTGATSGSGMLCEGSFVGTGVSQTIEARLGPKTATTVLTISDRFNSNSYPYLIIEEQP